MNLLKAMQERHAVRNYQERKIEKNILDILQTEIEACNSRENLSIQLLENDEGTFKGFMPYFGKFRGVTNCIALVGPVDANAEEKLGYCGEHLVLKAQQLGLNTCWVSTTFNKRRCKAVVKEHESMKCVIALGYGTTQGVPHKSKSIEELCSVEGDMPDWFRAGMEGAMLAPTGNNKQLFQIKLNGDKVSIEVKEGKLSRIDLGIVKYHFEKAIQFRYPDQKIELIS